MDIVYILGKDLRHDYVELRYSIRSMVKHLDKVGKLIIVGECPEYLKGAIHIPAPDQHQHNTARNIYQKILAACDDRRVSGNFMCCSDDYFLLRDFTTEGFPYFYDDDLVALNKKLSPTSGYKAYIESTLKVLRAQSLPVLNYNVHVPIVYNKKLFKKLMPAFDWTVKKGYVAKSLYANAAGITGQPGRDIKIYTPKTKSAIGRKIAFAPYFSTNEYSINDEMKETLQELFPTPSRWEV